MTTQDRLFLIVSDREAGTSTVEELGHDLSSAMEVYASRERETAGRPDVEIVLIGSPSLRALKSTHSSFFDASAGLQSVLAAETE